MRKLFKFIFIILFIVQFLSCEAFFTSNWFKNAADISNISVEEAINSGDKAIMQEIFDRIVLEAAVATGQEAADLYLQAADLALGISGLSNPAILFQAPELPGSGDGSTGDLFSILTDTDLDLDALEDVGIMIANANASNPGSVSSDMWIFAAAGNGAAVVNDAEDAGMTVDDYLGADPMTNPDANAAVQALVNALDVLPEDIARDLYDNQVDLEADGIIFP